MHLLNTYIVEDSQVIRDDLIAALEELTPVRVIGTAGDEATATQWLQQHDGAVDLVIVDIFLKAGSGLGVLRSAQLQTGSCSMVVLCNYATVDIRRKCLDLGADQVFDKSTEIDALIAHCAALAQAKRIQSIKPFLSA
jgi:DNA-binding NarL/FixJ family response regulator